MSIKVNPPPTSGMPPEFASKPDLRQYFQERDRILLQLWLRTGGASDEVDNSLQTLTSTGSRVSLNSAKINALEKVAFDIEMITADFTTSKNQIVICKNTSTITVTLDPDAIEEDTVHIKRTDAVVEVTGTIDGFTNKTINVKFFSLHLVFNGTDWSQI